MTVSGPDVSFYQDDNSTPQQIDFQKLGSVSDFVIIRAGQNLWVDPDFAVNWTLAKDAGVPRGSYWFYDSRVSPIDQAELWAATLGSDLGELPMFADYEENYGGPFGGWRNFKLFLEELKTLCVNKEIYIYTAYYYWKDHCPNPLTEDDELEYFHQYPLWIANYGATSPAVPLPWAPNEWRFWQYTDKGNGSMYGVESSTIDLNYYNGTEAEFSEWIGVEIPTNFNEYLYKITPENLVRAYVTSYSSNQTVARAAKDFHATCQPGNHSIVINGDGWRSSGVSNGDWVSDGMWKHTQPTSSYSPRITFDKNNKGAIAGARGEYWYPEKVTDHNAFGLTRRLVKEGKINPAYSDTGELNSRTTFGFTPDGTLVIYACDGWDYNSVTHEPPKGRTIKETGEILIANGCVEAGDGDGGGSVTIAEDGVVVNSYSDDGIAIMRPTVNHLCLEVIELDGSITPPEGDKMNYEVLHTVRKRPEPSMYQNFEPTKDVMMGYKFSSDSVVTVTEKISGEDVTVKWVQLPDGAWAPFSYKGNTYIQQTAVVPPVDPDPPVEPGIIHNISVYDDGKISVDNGEPY